MQDDADGNGRDPDQEPASEPDPDQTGADAVDEPDGSADPVATADANAEPMGDAAAEQTSEADAEPTDDAEPEQTGDGDGESESVDGVDTEHVMNLTFVLTLAFGVPTVVVLSLFVPLDGWNEIISFVVRVGAAIWFLTAVTLYVRERIRT